METEVAHVILVGAADAGLPCVAGLTDGRIIVV